MLPSWQLFVEDSKWYIHYMDKYISTWMNFLPLISAG